MIVQIGLRINILNHDIDIIIEVVRWIKMISYLNPKLLKSIWIRSA